MFSLFDSLKSFVLFYLFVINAVDGRGGRKEGRKEADDEPRPLKRRVSRDVAEQGRRRRGREVGSRGNSCNHWL